MLFRSDLRIGIGLPGTTAPAVQLIDFDTLTGKGTRAKLSARLVADDIDLRLKAGPFDVGIDSGRVVFDADGKVADAAAATDGVTQADAPASISVALKDGAPAITTEGAFSINLPLTFVVGTRTVKLGDLSVATNPAFGARGLEAFARELANQPAFPKLTVDGKPTPALVVKLPDFDVFNAKPPSLLDILYDPSPVLDGKIGRAHV